jgi:hypothetical protein
MHRTTSLSAARGQRPTVFYMDEAPTLAECQREEAESLCARFGHVLGENEDGETICERCGDVALEWDEPERPLCRHFEGPDCEDCR